MKEYKKLFLEERSQTLHKTLTAAKKAHRFPYVYRVWVDEENKIVGKYALFAYGDSIGKIKTADITLARELNAN